MKKFNLFILVLSVVLFAGTAVYLRTAPPPTVSQLPTTISISPSPGLVLSGSSAIYPDPTLTPGSVFPDVTADKICVSGYSASVRDVPVSEKKQVYTEYGLTYPQATGTYEADHFIPLELGGDNELTNLWPEPAEPRPGYKQKDRVENYLHDQVCRHGLPLTQAQSLIHTDWYAVYQTIPNQ